MTGDASSAAIAASETAASAAKATTSAAEASLAARFRTSTCYVPILTALCRTGLVHGKEKPGRKFTYAVALLAASTAVSTALAAAETAARSTTAGAVLRTIVSIVSIFQISVGICGSGLIPAG